MALIEQEFGAAYQTEVAALLRRRFRLLCMIWGGGLLLLAVSDFVRFWGEWWLLASYLTTHTLQGVVLAGIWQRGRRPGVNVDELLRLAFWLVVLNAIVASAILHAAERENGVGFVRIGLGYLLACYVLPWTPWQAARPGVAVWLAWVLTQVLFGRRQIDAALIVTDVLIAAVVLPAGLLACWVRITRLGKRVESSELRQHYEEFHRELFDARKIHEAIFPKPRTKGAIRFAYRDAPRLGIGGDLLAAHESPDGSINLILLDVAGDGIAAALTVHRLHGEIERLFAESPYMRPREVIAALDRYAHLTLAPHGVFATGFAMRFESSGVLRWCGAGHPPAFIRQSDGSLRRLMSTTWPLGASDCLCDECDERIEALEADDVVIAHSDGACDWRNGQGEWLGYQGVEALVRTTEVDDPLQWPDVFLRQLDAFRGRHGESEEDVLVLAACVGEPKMARTALQTARFLFSRESESKVAEVPA